MRLWSLHPRYLDRQGLIALWRESLLAQAVVEDLARGYSRHPQLERFRASGHPLPAIGAYLRDVADEAETRGYRFARQKIQSAAWAGTPIPITTGQRDYEWRILLPRMRTRSPEWAEQWRESERPALHPLFTLVDGPIALWERVS